MCVVIEVYVFFVLCFCVFVVCCVGGVDGFVGGVSVVEDLVGDFARVARLRVSIFYVFCVFVCVIFVLFVFFMSLVFKLLKLYVVVVMYFFIRVNCVVNRRVFVLVFFVFCCL